MKALVVDDSRGARRLLMRYLSELDIETHDESLATTALEHLREGHEYDVALVNVNMPEMNGIEFIQIVRQNMKWDKMLLFIVTSEASPRRMREAMEAGADEYFLKPIKKEPLQAKLESLGFEFN